MRKLLLTLLLLAIATPAGAHDFWIQPASFWVAPGGATPVAILVGHGPARQPWLVRLNRVVTLRSIDPRGTSVDHLDALRQGTFAPDPILRFVAPGLHTVIFETNNALNTLPADRFTTYLHSEGLTAALDARTRAGATAEPGREAYSRRAKALVQVGPAGVGVSRATEPAGMTLEIVPEVNPYAPGRAPNLPVRVLFEGRPLVGCLVKLTDLDADAEPVETHVTSAGGRAVFRLPRAGRWQMNVVWSTPVIAQPHADFQTTFSSLTFGFAPPV